MKVDYSGMAEDLKNDLKKAVEQNKETLKICPFCGGEAVSIESYNHKAGKFLPAVMCLDCKSRTTTFLNTEDAIEVWNTRKSFERVIERLEEEERLADEEKERCAVKNPLQFDSAKGYSNGIYNAIQIIKEEFNIDELQNGSETQHSGTNCCNKEHIQKRFERVM